MTRRSRRTFSTRQLAGAAASFGTVARCRRRWCARGAGLHLVLQWLRSASHQLQRCLGWLQPRRVGLGRHLRHRYLQRHRQPIRLHGRELP